MCVAVLKPKGKRISKKMLTNMVDSNQDGNGIAYALKGKLYVHKEMRKTAFIKLTLKLQRMLPDVNMMIHCRIATSGINPDKMIDNCHPFAVSKDVVFCHNGILSNVRQDNDISDTRYFNMDILQELPFKFGNKAQVKLIEDFIGSSKMIFLKSDVSYSILYERLGSWNKGSWFSNLHHCTMSQGILYNNVSSYGQLYQWESQHDEKDEKKGGF